MSYDPTKALALAETASEPTLRAAVRALALALADTHATLEDVLDRWAASQEREPRRGGDGMSPADVLREFQESPQGESPIGR